MELCFETSPHHNALTPPSSIHRTITSTSHPDSLSLFACTDPNAPRRTSPANSFPTFLHLRPKRLWRSLSLLAYVGHTAPLYARRAPTQNADSCSLHPQFYSFLGSKINNSHLRPRGPTKNRARADMLHFLCCSKTVRGPSCNCNCCPHCCSCGFNEDDKRFQEQNTGNSQVTSPRPSSTPSYPPNQMKTPTP